MHRGDAEQQRAPQRQPGDQRGGAGAQPEQRRVAAGHPGQLGVGVGDPGHGPVHRAVGEQVGRAVHGVDQRGRELRARRGRPAARATAREGGRDGHADPGEQQPRREQRAARREQRGGQRDHARPGDQRRRGRREAAHQEVLGRVGVADEPGDEVAGPEPADRFGVREPGVDAGPRVGEGAQRGVVRDQPLQVAGDPAQDAERARRDDGDAEQGERRLRRGHRDEPRRHREQPDAGRGGGGAGEHAEGEAPGAGPAQREHPQQRIAPATTGPLGGALAGSARAAAARPVCWRAHRAAPEIVAAGRPGLEAHGLVRQVRPARVVGDDDPRRPVQQPGDARPHGGGVVRVEVRGRLVEQHQGGAVEPAQEGARQRDPLALARRQPGAALAEPGGQAVGQRGDDVRGLRERDGPRHGLVVGAGHPEPDVVGHGRVEQVRALRQPRDPPAPLVDGQVAQVHPVHRDPSLVDVGEPQQHRQQRRLPGAAGPGQQQGPPRRHGEVDAVQRRDHPRRMGQAHAREPQLRRPVGHGRNTPVC